MSSLENRRTVPSSVKLILGFESLKSSSMSLHIKQNNFHRRNASQVEGIFTKLWSIGDFVVFGGFESKYLKIPQSQS